MNAESIARIERQLGITLPQFYVDTMLNYPFPVAPSIEVLSLTYGEEAIINANKYTKPGSARFYIGSDGGEHRYFIKLNGEETVYIYDLEGSEDHMSVLATTWDSFISGPWETEKELPQDERKPNGKRWWQFWK
ncbi:SMI1/KNR4 family protein [Lewinella sp. W8]|uniref:SMI1/KNR4 family protein n=1 Tax=Lewinella sp. W8 TaxID=2528208 RepID=UPI0010675751|nr:SMI1/KNR4 family protein [Lewinella sp. W8]MTB50566.1 hypothetical protein [Lewinella sp. W8]